MPSAAPGLPGQQLAMIGIGALLGDAARPRRGARALGVAAHHGSHYLVVIVEARGGAVHGADERARSAADHAETQPPTHALDGGAHDRPPA